MKGEERRKREGEEGVTSWKEGKEVGVQERNKYKSINNFNNKFSMGLEEKHCVPLRGLQNFKDERIDFITTTKSSTIVITD